MHTIVPDYQVVVIGTGFSGLGMGIALKKAGFNHFTILEKADDVGGTWRDNHYPGCACDVQSHLYSFSFEPNPNWTRMYAPQPEIKAYLQHCARKYGLMPHIQFGQAVKTAVYEEEHKLWRLETASGQTILANVVVSGMGGLSTPAYPSIKGLSKFKGVQFHSQDWQHDYDLTGKRVAVIGTGASAIQFVPQIVPKVAHLDLYQRTPPWIMPKPDRDITRAERTLFKYAPQTQEAMRNAIYLQLESRVLGFVLNPRVMKLPELQARRHIRQAIKDPVLRKKVTPDYAFGCKRVLISNDYLPSLAQKNVDVITHGIKEVRAHSIVGDDGVERPIDAIIFGTGFKAQDPIPRGAIFGKGGVDLLDTWQEGAQAYLGSTMSGFPNLFLLMGPNTGLGHSSMVFMIESQVAYVMDFVKKMQKYGWKEVDVKAESQQSFNTDLQEKLGGAVWSTGCQSWYVNASGKNTTLWPGFTFDFRRKTARFDAQNYQIDR
ncbi:flavin-containing monooxygenase [Agitococcus lubricus]|uniref:Cyclohexanone monooxygenase n=1 Tax=Agitococcus lubricus TaxID=1077255 RepID=A0A2T5IYH4_9GAMM|nr:NAD(P)/FAD-dependent oxidoreductase [Agitococcus lubricus]PTQ89041.1 cyclohexanone monooxygenase [Agitococcus lubricus]